MLMSASGLTRSYTGKFTCVHMCAHIIQYTHTQATCSVADASGQILIGGGDVSITVTVQLFNSKASAAAHHTAGTLTPSCSNDCDQEM